MTGARLWTEALIIPSKLELVGLKPLDCRTCKTRRRYTSVECTSCEQEENDTCEDVQLVEGQLLALDALNNRIADAASIE